MRTLRSLAVVPVLVVTLAACGGSSGGGSTATTSSGPHSTVTVHAKDQLKFDKTAYTAKAGTVDIDYVNDGTIPHTLQIQGVKGFKKLGIGKEAKGSVTLAKGTYTLFCDLPGHEAAGMKATLTVS